MTERSERCNNTSVGILVSRQGDLLLIERRKPPYGWAPPAGHVDDGETYEVAAARELLEEVGLRASSLSLVLSEVYENQCRRPGGNWHRWAVYRARVSGELMCAPAEVCSVRWVTPEELEGLAARTRAYLAGSIPEGEWMRSPGVEPVWCTMLTKIGLITR